MNLIEAIASGRLFKRPDHNVYMREVDCDELRADGETEALFLRDAGGDRISLMPHDLEANDWEIQEPTVTITREDFWKACKVFMPVGHAVGMADALNQVADNLFGAKTKRGRPGPGGHVFINGRACACGHTTSDDPVRCPLDTD